MRKLGKTLVLISLILLVVDYGWASIWAMRIEPAGNFWQLLFFEWSYQLARVFSFVMFSFANSQMALFWLGVGMWIVGKHQEESEEETNDGQ